MSTSANPENSENFSAETPEEKDTPSTESSPTSNDELVIDCTNDSEGMYFQMLQLDETPLLKENLERRRAQKPRQ